MWLKCWICCLAAVEENNNTGLVKVERLSSPDDGSAQPEDDGGDIDAVLVKVEVLGSVEEVGEGGEDHAEPSSHRHHQAWGQPAGQSKHPVYNTVPNRTCVIKISARKCVYVYSRDKSINFKLWVRLVSVRFIHKGLIKYKVGRTK